MRNLNEMTSKELKEIGKQLQIKNWWKLTKAELIEKIQFIRLNENDDEEIEDPILTEEEIADEEEIESLVEEETNTEASNSSIEETSEEPKQNVKPKIKKPNLKLSELTYKGKTQSIRAWAAELEMPWPTLYDRVNRNGWTVEDAIETPLGQRRPK